MLKDNASIRGIVNLVLRDQHGRVKQHKTIRNAVTEDGIAHIIGRMIDTGQDRNGLDDDKKHLLPRMMSHMGIGTGDPALDGNAGQSTTVSASTTNRFLQNEVGKRVQVMKDTSRTVDYTSYQLTVAQTDTDNAGNSFNGIVVGDTFFKLLTSAATTGTLRVGMSVELSGHIPAGTVIASTVDDSTGVTTVNLHDADGNPQAIQPNGLSAGTVVGGPNNVTFEYTGVIGTLSPSDIAHPFRGISANDPIDVTDYSDGDYRGLLGAYYDTVTPPAGATNADKVLDNSKKAPFIGEADDAPTNFSQFGTDIDGIFQGTRVGTSIVEDKGSSPEGYHRDENDYLAQPTPQTNNSLAPNAVRGTKKTGNRIVFVATFKEQNPNTTTLVREAGIFNSRFAHTGFGSAISSMSDANYNAANTEGSLINAVGGGQLREYSAGSPRGGEINQTMLCRTTFDVVTKAALDTLQITWSVQLADQTP